MKSFKELKGSLNIKYKIARLDKNIDGSFKKTGMSIEA